MDSVKKKYPAYEMLSESTLEEIDSSVQVFIHKKTGAKCILINNKDDNRVFYIAFRTPPSDHTGVFHILEHSVLCGSKKYPSKEPFLELAKGSLNTFLNAMTYPDKTVYPVASRNITDFRNLVDVYLDAVFSPVIYEKKAIFAQEGWHYELNNIGDDLTIQGIVYNEMKGAYSSPDSVLFDGIMEALYPDNVYRFESGGKPEHIKELTYDAFIRDHQKYYHPSNSFIYLYGDLDTTDWLHYLDEAYLSNFESIQVDTAIAIQKPFEKEVTATVCYAVGPQDETEHKTYLSLNFAAGLATDPMNYMGLDILEHILLGTPASPLKKALLEADIAQEISGYVDLNIQQPMIGIIAKNANPEKRMLFIQIIHDTLNHLAEQGIDQKLIQGSINIHEFQLREADYQGFPKGLFYGLTVMDSWLYDGDPVIHLKFNPILEKIRKLSTEGYFESLITQHLLNNPHKADIMAMPSKGMEEKLENTISKELSELKFSSSQETIQQWLHETRSLKKMQETPDNEEDLQRIPLLKREDIEAKSEILPLQEDRLGNSQLLLHPLNTSNILYLNVYFDLSALHIQDLPYLHLLTYILGKIGTRKYPYEDLSNELYLSTGGVHFDEMTVNDYHDTRLYHRLLNVQAKALTPSVPRLMDLLNEIICHTQLADSKRIRELLFEMKSSYESSIYHHGHLLAAKRLNSYFSPTGFWIEQLSGLSFYHFLVDHERQWNSNPDELIHALENVYQRVFSAKNLIFSLTCPENDFQDHQSLMSDWLNQIPSRLDEPSSSIEFQEQRANEGILSSSKVQYVLKGYNYKRLGFPYKGALQVMETIASLDYLWNRIRVIGGAYGAFIRLSRTGRIILGSYRDPHLDETLKVFDQMGAYLHSLDISERELQKYVIGTMSQIDAPLTPSMKGQKADIQFISQVSAEDIQRERDEILSVDLKNIRELSDWMDACMAKNCYCVLGNERKLNEHKNLFGSLIKAIR